MSLKEQAMSAIDTLTEAQVVCVINYINEIKDKTVDEVKPDEWDLKMIAEAERENDGSTIAFEEMLKREGLTYADL